MYQNAHHSNGRVDVCCVIVRAFMRDCVRDVRACVRASRSKLPGGRRFVAHNGERFHVIRDLVWRKRRQTVRTYILQRQEFPVLPPDSILLE